MEKFFNRMGQLGAALLVGGIVLTRFTFVVDGGERAVIFNKIKGVQNKVYGEGMHLMVPLLMVPKRFEVRSKPQTIHSSTGTRDQQNVDLSLRILYRPVEEKLAEILNNLGQDYDERVIPSIGNEVLKSVVAQYNADQLLTQREKVSLEIRDILSKRAQEFDIHLDDVSITHLQFSKEFAHAIEQKQVAQQMAERSKFIVMVREEEMKAAVLRAEGEAEAAQLVADAISKYGQGLVAMRKIEAAQHIVEALQSNPNITFLSGNALNMVNIPGTR